MCGILGVAGSSSPPEVLLAPLDLLRHRGPDSEGRFTAPGVALAIRRLAIIDLTGGDQPLASEDGRVVVICNGEIYNYVELRRELQSRGHTFATGSDVEVVAHLYEDQGEACFARLRGMFAVALWDDRRRRLVLARDRFGIKPLYLGAVDDGIAFASEIAPLLALGVAARPDIQGLADFLSLGYVPGEGTGLSDIRALRPGHMLLFADGQVTEREFAAVVPETRDLEQTLVEAVRVHLRSDVPLAVLLSGGLDSSLLAAMAAAELEQPLRTFTVGFGDAAFDEVEPARIVAEAIGSDHHEVSVRPQATDLPEIACRLEEPNGDVSAVLLITSAAPLPRRVEGGSAGEGGDEAFGG